MSITAVVVVFAITWFIVFFCVLPYRFKSQADVGTVVPGTPKSAPAEENVKKKAWITTFIAVPIAVIICAIIMSGAITIRDLDFRGVMGPDPEAGGTNG